MADLTHVHRFEPARAPGRPAILLLHGTGGDEDDLIPLGRSLLPGAAMLSPRGKVRPPVQKAVIRRIAPGVRAIPGKVGTGFSIRNLRR